ncbi:ATP-binding protein [Termitidicoccus mucosus]|uniref:histidine kinase n=1 Tax=Termitidicoccus mucosus TaxID=1184151 RepID=A0A178IMK1_9BACT|nr:histidine kinase [Opitutaceae bacterium TSB47]
MPRLTHSIRWRVQVWHGLILLVALAALSIVVNRLAWQSQLTRIDATLEQAEKHLVRALFSSIPREDLDRQTPPDILLRKFVREKRFVIPPELAPTYTDTAPGHHWFVCTDADGSILIKTPNAPPGYIPPPAAASDTGAFLTRGRHRESAHTLPGGITFAYGRDITPDLDARRRFAGSLALLALALWATGLIGGWWLAGRALRPIRAISRTATRIAAGDLAERIDTSDTDNELDQLGRVLNETFDRLAAALERQRRFTADASHELRTPLTILLSETQRALKRDRTPDDYRAILATCRETGLRMRRLIEALLLLARQETASHLPARVSCDLAGILRETARQLAPLAADRGINLHLDLRPAPVRADPETLAILAANLLSNAIDHHRPDGDRNIWLATETAPDQSAARVVVRDDGPGIPPGDLPHIFERFHRADKARTATPTPHAGLGLAIAQAIAQNHAATLAARNNTPPPGATFELVLPAVRDREKPA